MSVLIKGMQIPQNCAECPVALSGKYCRINQTYTTYIKLPIRPDHCPLVELPEKHGRLIDENDVIKMLDKGWKTGIYPSSGNIRALKAVVEAEGETDEM